MTKHKFGLSEQVFHLLHGVFASFPDIDEVIIFGSRAKGAFREGSDIDLAIVVPGFTYDDLLRLKVAIDDLTLLYQLDVLDFDKIENEALKQHILRVGQVFYKKSKTNLPQAMEK